MARRGAGEGRKSGVTALDVAKMADVSQSAVSRAFTPGSSITPKLRTRILLTAEKLGYKPNLLARSLTSGRTNIIGVGVGNLKNPFFSESLELLSQELEQAGYRLLLFPLEAPGQMEMDIQDVLRYQVDALIVLSARLTSTLATECKRARVPVILYNRISCDPEISSIVGDNETGARAIAAFFHATGHTAPAIITGLPESSTSRIRQAGFEGYYKDMGLPPPVTEKGEFSYDMAASATRRLLLRSERPDAIFCANDFMAFAAINVARFEFGLEPGRDISIIGYDNVAMAGWSGFALTTFEQPVAEMVKCAVELISELRNNPDFVRHEVVSGQLVIRASARTLVKEKYGASANTTET